MKNSRTRRRTRSAMLLAGPVVLAGLLWLPAPGLAANAVHFDPDSPSGKEYALPLDQARDEASGGPEKEGGEGNREEEAVAPLFGEGITRGGENDAAGGKRRRGGTSDAENGTSDSENGSGGGVSAAPGSGGSDRRAGGDVSAGGEDGYPFLTGAALVALVVLVGAALGVGLRTLQRVRPG